MKYLPLLLGIAVSCIAPLAAQADPNVSATDAASSRAKTKSKTTQNRVVVTAPAPPQKKQPPVRYEVTNMTVAGSHLPVVVYHRGPEMYTGGNSFQPRKAYRREGGALDTTGANNVAGELVSLDPAFH